jgi:hypothetical protein
LRGRLIVGYSIFSVLFLFPIFLIHVSACILYNLYNMLY